MDIKANVISGLKWNSIASGINTITKLGKITILTRILEPSDFGVMGMLMVIIGFSHPFSTAGISNAIIYFQSTSKKQLSSLFWLNVFSGLVVACVIILFKDIIADFYKEPVIGIYLVPISAVFIIMPLGLIYKSLLQKEMKFSILSKIETLGAIVDFSLSVIFAFFGYGVGALILGFIGGNLFTTAYFFVSGKSIFRPKCYFNFRGIKPHLRFGIFHLGEQSINYVSSNVDYLIIGRFLGKEALGIYSIAFQIISIPWTYLVPIFSKVMFPYFAKVQKDLLKLETGFLQLTKVLAYLIFPLLAGIAVTSSTFIPLIFGVDWIEAIVVVQILSILGIFKVLVSPIWNVFLSQGKSDLGFYYNVVMSILNTIVFYFVVEMGIKTLSWSYVLLNACYFLINIYLLSKIMHFDSKRYFGEIVKPSVYVLIMISFVSLLKYLVINENMAKWLGLSIIVLGGAAIFLLQMFLFDRKYIKEIKKIVSINK